ncbi:MAG: quinone oxidoreductase [Burkholderia gladioli]
MKVSRIHRHGGPEVFQYEDVETPSAGPGEVLVRVESASVNYADVNRRNNDPYPFPSPLPFIPGSEVAGVVEAVGDGVTGVATGAHVFAVLENGGAGGYAQYAVAKAEKVIPLPEGLNFDQACSLIVAGMTGLQSLTDCANLQPGETVLVHAAGGGVGTYAVQIARHLGAGRIIATASTEAKRRLALELGADYAIDYTRAGWVQEVLAMTAGRGVDVVLESTGGEVVRQSIEAMAPFGRIVVFGAASRDRSPLNPYALLAKNQSLITYYVNGWFVLRRDAAVARLNQLADLIRTGAIRVQIGHVFALRDAAKAHQVLAERGSAGKIILKPWADPA